MPGPPVSLGCTLPLGASLLPPPANVSVGLRQLFVKRSCVDASLAWLRAFRSRVTALPRACQGRTGLAEIQGQRQYDMFGLFLLSLCWSNIPEGGAGPTGRSVPDGDRNSHRPVRRCDLPYFILHLLRRQATDHSFRFVCLPGLGRLGAGGVVALVPGARAMK